MDDNNNGTWGVIFTIIFFVGIIWYFSGFGKYQGESAEYWFNQYDEGQSQLQSYKDALQEANDNIDQANSNIDYAKMYAWESYEDMGDALDGLDTVDTVSEPY